MGGGVQSSVSLYDYVCEKDCGGGGGKSEDDIHETYFCQTLVSVTKEKYTSLNGRIDHVTEYNRTSCQEDTSFRSWKRKHTFLQR